VLGESSGVIAIRKPAGLATQAPPGIPSVESWLRDRLHAGDRSGYVGVPHRLDRAVSGVLLMAATPRAARKLSRQFERRQVVKTYLAVVTAPSAGDAAVPPCGSTDEWRDLVEKLPTQARSRIADPASPAAREAVTLARRLPASPAAGRSPGASEPLPAAMILQLEPRTGRMHQLRLQSAVRGMPIVGDELYGGRPLAGGGVPVASEQPILLHAWRITYLDPDANEPVTIEAPLPDQWPDWVRLEILSGASAAPGQGAGSQPA
jgi:23S rRNA pseudouridine1911/1915/1917 synthase